MAEAVAVSSTDDIPILIISDDDESDSDDVVLIKEEIDIDNDDVIFLSETRPDPSANKPSYGSVPQDGTESQQSTAENKGCIRSQSLSTLTTDLNLHDTSTVDDPLDLSSKVSDTTTLASGIDPFPTARRSLLAHTNSSDADAMDSFLPSSLFFQTLDKDQPVCSTTDDLVKLQSSTDGNVTGSNHANIQQTGVMHICSDPVPGMASTLSEQPSVSMVCAPHTSTSPCPCTGQSVSLDPDHAAPYRWENPAATGPGSSQTGQGAIQVPCNQSNSQCVDSDKQQNDTSVLQIQPLSNSALHGQDASVCPSPCSVLISDFALVSNKPDAMVSRSGQVPSSPVLVPAIYKPTPLLFDSSPQPNFSMAPSVTTMAPPVLTSTSPVKAVNNYMASFSMSPYPVIGSDSSLITTPLLSVSSPTVDASNSTPASNIQSTSDVLNHSVPVTLPITNTDPSNDLFVNSQMLLNSLDPMWSHANVNNPNSSLMPAAMSSQSVPSSAIVCIQSTSVNTQPITSMNTQPITSTISVSQPASSFMLLGGLQQNFNPQSSVIRDLNTYRATNCSLDIYVSGPNDVQSVTVTNQGNTQPLYKTSVCNSASLSIPSNTIAPNFNFNPLKRSLSLDQPMYKMYNPLTLPKSMHPLLQKPNMCSSDTVSSIYTALNDSYKDLQSQRLQRSLSIPSASDAGPGGIPSASDAGPGGNDSSSSKTNVATMDNSQPRGLHQLPPKKQKRCFSVDSCARCCRQLTGEKFSRCPQSHGACSTCLEERVKLVLTGKAKGSVKCLNNECEFFYSISELKLSLPSMVVEILEDKLDFDYIDFVSDMMIKNATGDEGAGPSSRDPRDVEMDEGGACLSMKQKDPELPHDWEPMGDNKEPYVLVNLEPDSDEYGEVVLRFFQSMTDTRFEIQSVYRLQNAIQWKYYCVKKMEMRQDNEGFGSVEVRQLFHGTTSSVVDAICKKGFDWRLCGKHGTIYGQGSYFAVNASYSHQYTDAKRPQNFPSSIAQRNAATFMYNPLTVNFSQPSQITPVRVVPQSQGANALNLSSNTNTNSNPLLSAMINWPHIQSGASSSQQQPQPQRYKVTPKPLPVGNLLSFPGSSDSTMERERHTAKLFLASVLVGKYVGGNSKLRKPPPLYPKEDPFGKCYDSCVDNIHFPKIFVIFESAQAYPEYLIEYSYE